MIRMHWLPFAALLSLSHLALAQHTLNPQQKRGHELFVASQKGTACATCHSLAGEGSAVGPDLTMLGSLATPAGLKIAILSTQTAYVQAVKMKGKTFPGMKAAEDAKTVDYYDLSQNPPARRKLNKSDIDSASGNSQWKHPPESTGYSEDELQDVIAYVRYAAKLKN